MSVIAGYWSGYLSGLLTGVTVGWIISSLRRYSSKGVEDTSESGWTWVVPREEWEKYYPSPGAETRNERENTPLSDPINHIPGDIRDQDNLYPGENIIYYRLTDKSLAAILETVKPLVTGTFAPQATSTPVPGFRKQNPEDSEGLNAHQKHTNHPDSVKEELAERKVPDSILLPEDTIGADEMTGIFEEEDKVKGRTIEETLDVGRNMPVRPVAYLTSVGGGYATMGQIENIGKKHAEYKEAVLSRSEELEIIQAFRGIIGNGFYDVQGGVKAQGYSLHVLYVGDGPKRPAQFYSATTLGVRIKDDDFEAGIPSVHAIITDIIDVGGMDARDKGSHRI